MPLLWLSLAFLTGIGLAQAAALPGWAWALAAGVFALAAFLERRLLGRFAWWQRWRAASFLPAAALLAALCLGGWRYISSQPVWQPGDLAYYHSAEARVLGVVVEPPRSDGEGTRILLQAEQITLLDADANPLGEPIEVRGRLVAVLWAGQELRYGDRVELTGNLQDPLQGEGGSYRLYLAARDIHSSMQYPLLRWVKGGAGSPFWTAVYGLRQSGVEVLRRTLPQPESSLLTGILLGVEDYIPQEIERDFQVTGTAHIVAISGFNMAILISLCIRLFRGWLPRVWAVAAAVAVTALYTLLVGAQPAVVRAAVMGGMGLVGAELLGRRQAGANSLAFTAAVMAFSSPLLLWDAGFQLSFTATLGLILLGNPMQAAFAAWLERRLPLEWARRVSGPVGEYILLTLGAQIATLPVILSSFGNISLGSLLANPLVLPAQPLVMILGGLSLLAGWIWLPLGQILGWLAWVPLTYTIHLVQLLAPLSQGMPLPSDIGYVLAAVFYLLAFAWPLWKRLLGRWLRLSVIFLVLGLVAVLLARGMAAAPDGRLHVILFDGGEVPVLLVRGPQGGNLLIQGSGDSLRLEEQLGRWLSPFDTALDWALVPSQKAGAVRALRGILDRYTPRQVWWNEHARSSSDADHLRELLEKRGIALEFMQAGQEINLGRGVILRLLAVEGEGAAIWLEWENFRLLIPGGVLTAAQAGEAALIEPGFLLLSAVDLEDSTAEEWSALSPGMVIWLGEEVQAGEQDGGTWYNLPSAGWLHLSTDGRQAWVEAGD